MSWNILRQNQPLLGLIIAGGLTVLTSTAAVWGQNESDKVTASDGAANDWFGGRVSIDGDTAIVGARLTDDDGANSGSAYIFKQDSVDPSLWNEVIELNADDGFAGDLFGMSVAINGNVAVVGAPMDDHGSFTDAGSVYVFRYSGGTWTQEAKLTASDAATNDQFGNAVAIEGNLIVVGAARNDDACPLDPICNSGAAYVFRYALGGWSEKEILLASDANGGDAFGISVAFTAGAGDEVIIVGAWGDDDDGTDESGSVYVYRFDGTDWIEETKLHASNPWIGAFFGTSVSISYNRVAVGARWGFGFHVFSGSAYVFKYDGTDWNEEDKLIASEAGVTYGSTISISNHSVIVGAPSFDHSGLDEAGVAWVYHYDGTDWIEEAKLIASDAAEDDHLGSVGLSGGIAFVGARFDDDNGTDSGSAYVFDPVCPCPWDLDGDGGVGAIDLIELLDAWGTDPGGPPDFDDNGDVGGTDLLALLVNWGLCPCVEGTAPPTLEEELADACLSPEDWDEFVAVMTDPESSEEDKDRYKCWMIHYIDHCNKCTCPHLPECPSPDPFN